MPKTVIFGHENRKLMSQYKESMATMQYTGASDGWREYCKRDGTLLRVLISVPFRVIAATK